MPKNHEPTVTPRNLSIDRNTNGEPVVRFTTETGVTVDLTGRLQITLAVEPHHLRRGMRRARWPRRGAMTDLPIRPLFLV
jgi:hypothetical protein